MAASQSSPAPMTSEFAAVVVRDMDGAPVAADTLFVAPTPKALEKDMIVIDDVAETWRFAVTVALVRIELAVACQISVSPS